VKPHQKEKSPEKPGSFEPRNTRNTRKGNKSINPIEIWGALDISKQGALDLLPPQMADRWRRNRPHGNRCFIWIWGECQLAEDKNFAINLLERTDPFRK
jgi:hypothetical protein